MVLGGRLGCLGHKAPSQMQSRAGTQSARIRSNRNLTDLIVYTAQKSHIIADKVGNFLGHFKRPSLNVVQMALKLAKRTKHCVQALLIR